MNGAEHLAWAKQRALAELDADPSGSGAVTALTSLVSDLRKHPETASHPRIPDMITLMKGYVECAEQARLHIEGYR